MYKAKKKAKEYIEGNHAKTCSKLRQNTKMVRAANPSFAAKLQVKRIDITSNPIFKRFFLCQDAMKNGFYEGM